MLPPCPAPFWTRAHLTGSPEAAGKTQTTQIIVSCGCVQTQVQWFPRCHHHTLFWRLFLFSVSYFLGECWRRAAAAPGRFSPRTFIRFCRFLFHCCHCENTIPEVSKAKGLPLWFSDSSLPLYLNVSCSKSGTGAAVCVTPPHTRVWVAARFNVL